MRIGVAGPIDLVMLRDLFSAGSQICRTYSFPLTASLARSLHNKGHNLALFALSREVTEIHRVYGERITAYICPRRRPRSQMLDFFRGERRVLCAAMREAKCDVIHAHWTYEFASAAIESGVPAVVTAHDIPTVVLRFARHPYWLERPLLAWPVLRNAKCITAVSPYVAQALRRFVKPDRQIAVVPNGATSEVFALYEKRIPRSIGASFRFASVLNGWGPRKNGFRLIQAFAVLRKEFGECVELSMFGEGHEPGGPAQQWARLRHLDPGVTFEGSVPHNCLINRLVSSVDALVHPSREETFGMAILEAMALGIPVIAGKFSGAVPWVLGFGAAGLLVDVVSATSIASGMRSLLVDSQLRNALAHSGRQKALDEYRLEEVTDQYEAVLAKAVQEQTAHS
ncbi:MAG: glycosyltransferase family 4 protein [Acidobacteriia bacterium]|nr:glycosyltransferase family 4 protein [Terriglobia bacterium]